MSEQQSRVKIITGKKYGDIKIIESETGNDLVKSLHITSLVITCDGSTGFMPVAHLKIFDFDVEVEEAQLRTEKDSPVEEQSEMTLEEFHNTVKALSDRKMNTADALKRGERDGHGSPVSPKATKSPTQK